MQVNGLRVAIGAGLLSVGRVSGDLFFFLLLLLFARIYGVEGVGLYGVALGLAGIIGVLSDAGLYQFSIMTLSRPDESRQVFVGKILVIRALLSTLIFGALGASLWLLEIGASMSLMIAAMSLYQILHFAGVGLGSVFLAVQKTYVVVALEFIAKFVSVSAAVFVSLSDGTLLQSILVMSSGSGAFAIAMIILVRREVGEINCSYSIREIFGTLRSAFPFASGEFFRQLGSRIDVILLALFLGVDASGIYNAAYRVVFMVTLLMSYVGLAFLPLATKLHHSDRKKRDEIYGSALKAMVLLGVPCAAGLWLVRADIVDVLFGASFRDAAEVLGILAWSLVPACLQSVTGGLLTACGLQYLRSRVLQLSAVAALAGNMALIPVLGVRGAAVATVIYAVCIVGGFMFYTSHESRLPFIWNRLLAAVVGSAAFVLVLDGSGLSLVLVIPLAVLIYLAVIAAFPEIRKVEFNVVLAALRRRH